MTTDIPDSWVYCTLDDLQTRISNGANVTQYEERVGYPISRIETIWNETIDSGRVKYIKEADSEFVAKYALSEGDILLSHINSDFHLGKTALYKNNPPVLIHGVNLLLIRLAQSVSSKFINYQFKFLRTKGAFIRAAQRAVNQSSINQKKLKSFSFVLPPIAEQHRIVEKIEELFSELDKGIESLRAAREQLKIYRQSLLKAAFEGKLTEEWRKNNPESLLSAEQMLDTLKEEQAARHKKNLESWGAAVGEWELLGKPGKKPPKPKEPKHKASSTNSQNEGREYWDAIPLGSLISFGPTNGWSPKAVDKATETKAITLTATTSGRFDGTHFKYIDTKIPEQSSLWIESGDILVQRGNTLEYVGVPCLYSGPDNEFIYPDLMMKIRPCDSIDPKFLVYVMSALHSRKYLWERAVGAAGSMPKINQETLLNLPIPIFCPAEQREIVGVLEAKLSAVDACLVDIEVNVHKAEAVRKAILKTAFSGRLVSQDPNDEPASALLDRIAKQKDEAAALAKKAKAAAKKKPKRKAR